jgi:hypothetical protein
MNPDLSSQMVTLELNAHKRFERSEILDAKAFGDFSLDEGKEVILVGACKSVVNVHGE